MAAKTQEAAGDGDQVKGQHDGCAVGGRSMSSSSSGGKSSGSCGEQGTESVPQSAVTSVDNLRKPLAQPVPQAAAGSDDDEGRDRSDGATSGEVVGKLLARYPDRVPIICKPELRSELPSLEKDKLLARNSMLCGELSYMVHKLLRQADGERKMNPNVTIYLIVNRTSLKTGAMLRDVYEKHRADDGYLYITYGAEKTLG
mmetsp:Transcript_17285/g.47823  ORF Transcript_17285/g.47823 Transcript_17285/m.47823 type:complete len:200 (-) Transcript_17285:188-787(-)